MSNPFVTMHENQPPAADSADSLPQKGANVVRRRSALGRGLSALMSTGPVKVPRESFQPVYGSEFQEENAVPGLPARTEEEFQDDRDLNRGMVFLPLDRIVPNSSQPRQDFDEDEIKALASSIKESGLLQPILVRKATGEAGPLASYEIVAGERRWRAAKMAGLPHIPAVLRQLDDREALELAIVENVQRSDLNPLEEAQAYQKLITDFGATQDQVAQTVSKDRSSVANTLRLLKLAPAVQTMLREGRISAGHGRALLPVNSPEIQLALAEKIEKENLSVRAVEQLINSLDPLKSKDSSKRRKEAVDEKRKAQIAEIEDRFRRVLGTKVTLQLDSGERGELRIAFYSQSELDSLIEKLGA